MGKLDKYLGPVPGYFEVGREKDFPWEFSGGAVWFGLLVVENGKIQRYGFTSAKSSKEMLLEALRALDPDDEVLLLGVWKGQYRTHLFVLNTQKAIKKLQKILQQ